MLKLVIPVNTQVFLSKPEIALIRYDFPVPAVPDIIISSGSGYLPEVSSV